MISMIMPGGRDVRLGALPRSRSGMSPNCIAAVCPSVEDQIGEVCVQLVG